MKNFTLFVWVLTIASWISFIPYWMDDFISKACFNGCSMFLPLKAGVNKNLIVGGSLILPLKVEVN